MGATLDHETFPQPAQDDVWLWRYMDLSKFAALLQKRALIFPRADLLRDPFEGSVPEANARFYEAIKRQLRTLGPGRKPDIQDPIHKADPEEVVVPEDGAALAPSGTPRSGG